METYQTEHLLGVHVSTASGLPKAVERALQLGCRAFQLFTANARQWSLQRVDPDTAEAFRRAVHNSGIPVVVSHAGYLLNLASPRRELAQKSMAALRAECERCHQLGIPLLVLHPGSCPAEERSAGFHRLGTALRAVLQDSDPTLTLCLELTAGQGATIGSSLEELAALLEASTIPERLGICVDTCHALAAGYRLDTDKGYHAFWARFEELLGREALRLLHLNDSAYPAASRRDRHAHIGLGYCGVACFARLLGDPRWRRVPMILETPKGTDTRFDQLNLSVLRRLATGEKLTREDVRSLWQHEDGAV